METDLKNVNHGDKTKDNENKKILNMRRFAIFELDKYHFNPIIRGGGGALRAQITFTDCFDPPGVQIVRRYFLTFPKHA